MGNKSPRIYFLPTLMTSGNLLCGFAATLSILHGTRLQGSLSERSFFAWAIGFITAAFVFDFLDGHLARMGGQESAFGREFDSLADLVSFGVAPALLACRILLKDFSYAGLVLAAVYLLCCALRLARFNCTAAAMVRTEKGKTFDGLPVPGAAGIIASLTWFSLSLTPGGHQVVGWKWLLPPLTLFLSFMMLSHFSYPSIRALDLRTRHPTLKLLVIVLVVIATVANYTWMPAVLFISYLFYGILHPFFSSKRRHEVVQKMATIESEKAGPILTERPDSRIAKDPEHGLAERL
jgi:CDP-diacylglycerol---serine O-phosphatidyltransferase